jgi:predicted nucleotidyltransferase
MDLTAPHRAVVAGIDGDVLVLLAGRNAPLSGRQIAQELSNRSHDGVRKSLDRLVEQGIVEREAAGRALMHALNREHVGAAAVVALANMRTVLWQRLRDALGTWDVPPRHASAFGSAARGDGTAASDIDLFLVRPDDVSFDDDRWRDQVDRLEQQVRDWTGNPASVIERAEHEIRAAISTAAAHPLLSDLSRDAIDLAGVPTHVLLRGGT